MTRTIAKALRDAVAEVGQLPTTDQEVIGRQILQHVEKLRTLREDLHEGLRSLDGGEGRELDVNDVIAEAERRYARGE